MSEEDVKKRRPAGATGILRFPPFEFDPAAGLVYRGDEETLLPPKAAHVLQLLLERPVELVTKDELIETVWEEAFVTESSLTDAISLLRKVLGDDKRDPTYIQTLHRRGYRFIAGVEQGTLEARAAEGRSAEGVSGEARVEAVTSDGGKVDSATSDERGELVAGADLGNYEILGVLGAGAMGTVYRARDISLDREVAIKALPRGFADDPERVARLEREAKLLASVSHPNIAAIHSLEDAGGIKFPVLELVEGETLEERLQRGRIPADEALEIGRQIAAAVASAHDQGVIHRDLKPANIKLTPEGQVKVLDFGLAKGLEVMGFAKDAAESPTASMTITGTGRGSIVGTAAYMSPEQARGQDVDARSDIWSFGCVLYEILAGAKAFDRKTVTDTLAAIVDRDPDWEVLPADVPGSIRSLVGRCLRKDRERRLHHIADARIEIEDALRGTSEGVSGLPVQGPVTGSGPTGRRIPLGWAAAAVVVVAAATGFVGWAVWGAARSQGSEPALVQRYSIPITSNPHNHRPALSPDGRHLIYRANKGDGGKVYHRRIGELDDAPIPGVHDGVIIGNHFFFSPDSEWFAYSNREGLWRIPVTGGTPIRITDGPVAGAWGPGDEIVFSRAGSIWSISASGGEPEPVAEPDAATGIVRYLRPDILPGGKGVVTEFRRGDGGVETAGIAVIARDTGKATIIAEQGTDPRYVPTGHIVYARGGALEALPFEPEALEDLAPPVRVVEGVRISGRPGLEGLAMYTFSNNGQLLYEPGGDASEMRRRMFWVDRQGNQTPVGEWEKTFSAVRLSPDGSKIAVEVQETRGGSARPPQTIWIYDLRGGSPAPLTNEGTSLGPLWTDDGESVVFNYSPSSDVPGKVFWRPADFSSAPQELLASTGRGVPFPMSWSGSGELVLHEMTNPLPAPGAFPIEERRILVAPIDGDRTAWSPLDDSGRFNQRSPMVSPDGRWVAYVERQAGRDEVYVRDFANFANSARHAVSDAGGFSPMWGRDSTELFYRLGRQGRQMIAARLQTEPEFRVQREVLFEGDYLRMGNWARTIYDYDREKDRFLMVKNMVIEEENPQFIVEVYWFDQLRRLAPPTPSR